MMPRKKSRHINFQKLCKVDKNNNSNNLYYSCHKNLNCMLKLWLFWKECICCAWNIIKSSQSKSLPQSNKILNHFFLLTQVFRERYRNVILIRTALLVLKYTIPYLKMILQLVDDGTGWAQIAVVSFGFRCFLKCTFWFQVIL